MIYFYIRDTPDRLNETRPEGFEERFEFRQLTEELQGLVTDRSQTYRFVKPPVIPKGGTGPLTPFLVSFFDEDDYHRILTINQNARLLDVRGFFPVSVREGREAYVRIPFSVLPDIIRETIVNRPDASSINNMYDATLPSALLRLPEASTIAKGKITIHELVENIVVGIIGFTGKPISSFDYEGKVQLDPLNKLVLAAQCRIFFGRDSNVFPLLQGMDLSTDEPRDVSGGTSSAQLQMLIQTLSKKLEEPDLKELAQDPSARSDYGIIGK